MRCSYSKYSLPGLSGLPRALGVLLLLAAFEVSVAVKGPPRLRPKHQRDQVVVVGETMRLVCPVESEQPLFVEWQKNGSTIHLGWDRFKVKQNGSLQVRDLELSDTGVYLCRATNGFGSIDFKYHVYVLANANATLLPPTESEEPAASDEAPTFVRSDSMREGPILQPVGSTLWLRCRAKGSPRPQITWLKDRRVLHDAADTGSGDPPGHRYGLRVANLTVEDSGTYTCRVQNRAGSINFTYTLEVIARSADTPEFMTPSLENLTVSVGADVVFQCHIRSNILPHIQWLKRVDSVYDERLRNRTITVHDQQFIVLQRGVVMTQKDGTYLSKLTLNSVAVESAGLYICAATNLHGFAFRSGHLTVLPNLDIDFIDDELTPSSLPPSVPIVVTAVIVIVVVVTCIILTLYMMRVKKESDGNPAGSKFKTAPFRPQRALPGFGVLPEKPRGSCGSYTFLGHDSNSRRDNTSSLQSEEPEEGTRVVRVLFECHQSEDKSLVGCSSSGVGGGQAVPPVSLQQHRHHHTHLHYKCREK